MNRRSMAIAGVAAALTLGTAAAAQEQETEPRKPVVEVKLEGDVLYLRPLRPYSAAEVRITGPHLVIDRTLERGEKLALSLSEEWGRPISDGIYGYQITLAPDLSDEVREVLAEARRTGDSSRIWELEKDGRLPGEPWVESGVFTVVGGKVVQPDRPEDEPQAAERRLEVEGDLWVLGDLEVKGAKKFVVPDPEHPGRVLQYASLEGPEVGVYLRGTAVTEEGRAEIELPQHFARLADPDSLTVQLTPLAAWGRLYVVEKSTRRLVIREAGGADGLAFDYWIQGVRAGHAGFEVEVGAGRGN